jgi:hypothetical protein
MRMVPFGTYGFAPVPLEADLLSLPEDVQDTLYFFTSFYSYIGDATDLIAGQVDEVDDLTEVELGKGQPFTVALRRYPVRGPIRFFVRPTSSPTTRVMLGYLETEEPDVEVNLQPMLLAGVPAAPFEVLPIVVSSTSTGTEVCVVAHQTVNLTLFVAAPDADDTIRFQYTPDDDPDAATTFLVNLLDGQTGFVKVVDRIPVQGPGTVTVDVTIATGPVVIYGYLSS